MQGGAPAPGKNDGGFAMIYLGEDPGVGIVLSWAFGRLWEQIGAVLLLSLVFLTLVLLTFSHLFEFIGTYLRMAEIGAFRAYGPGGTMIIPWAGLLLSVIGYTLLLSVFYVLLSRLSDMDLKALIQGGIGQLASRGLWVLWRLISAGLAITLIMSVIMLVTFIVGLFLGFILNLFGLEALAAITVTTIFVVAYFAGFLFSLSVAGALSISIFAASRDERYGILETWNIMRDYRGRLLIANFFLAVAYVIVEAAMSFAINASLPVGEQTAVIATLGFGALLTAIYSFLWLNVGAAFAHAVK